MVQNRGQAMMSGVLHLSDTTTEETEVWMPRGHKLGFSSVSIGCFRLCLKQTCKEPRRVTGKDRSPWRYYLLPVLLYERKRITILALLSMGTDRQDAAIFHLVGLTNFSYINSRVWAPRWTSSGQDAGFDMGQPSKVLRSVTMKQRCSTEISCLYDI